MMWVTTTWEIVCETLGDFTVPVSSPCCASFFYLSDCLCFTLL